jgi:S-adenosyl-L-methionine hydrolase (adenosine-forming)
MIITLTTDFGWSDPFVGIMKGVILGIAPGARIVDLTHDVGAYDINEAAFVVLSSYRYFPAGTVHVVVVDPGVGTARRPIAAQVGGHYFVAPDNGVLSFVLHSAAELSPVVHHISNQELFLGAVGHTFHGRDIFAPIAAHLSTGIHLDSVGERITDFISQPLPRARSCGEGRLTGRVIRIDRFGNIITDLYAADLGKNFNIRIGGRDVNRLCRTFAEAEPNELFAVEGSTGYIEIALNQGAAADRLKVVQGAEIEVETGVLNH